MEHLIEPTEKYIFRIENSWHYLNCPKHMLNHNLNSMYLAGINKNKEYAIELVLFYLRDRNYKSTSRKTAVMFVEWRSTITLEEFNLININSYNNKLPDHIIALNNKVNDWIKKNTTYYPFTDIIKNNPSYPFLFTNH